MNPTLNPWTALPPHLHSLVSRSPGSVLLETARFDRSNSQSLVFVDPVRTIEAKAPGDIPGLFDRIEEAVTSGHHVAGYVGYECGYHFQGLEGIAVAEADLPLAWFGIYRDPIVYEHVSGDLEGEIARGPLEATVRAEELGLGISPEMALDISKEDYFSTIDRIKQYLAAGDTYQVNFTDRVRFTTALDADQMFRTLLRQQGVGYSALLNVGGRHIVSLSPELFFETNGRRIVTRPMKGTMPRGMDLAEDDAEAVRLQNDEKNRSEHVMIVDLLRNDLGRICTMGSVAVDDLFSVERYETLLQMTSTVSGELRRGLSFYEIFKGLFPSGSITGAPKIRTMEIIHELERRPRGVYTGAIGYIAPNRSAAFSVAIRTLVSNGGEAVMGVGGGIVADSVAEEEYRECLLKTEFLVRPRRNFRLIETMLWDAGFSLLTMHLDRIEASAQYFGFECSRAGLAERLAEAVKDFASGQRYRVRLLLSASGQMEVASTQYAGAALTGMVRLSDLRTASDDVLLRHKTTQRELYDCEFAAATAAGLDEVIFRNEREEITEGAISNIFVRAGGRLSTPPLRCGVLPGVYRRFLLESTPDAEERVLTLRDLETADAIYLCNSVRGMWQVRVTAEEPVLQDGPPTRRRSVRDVSWASHAAPVGRKLESDPDQREGQPKGYTRREVARQGQGLRTIG